jgi:3-phenylpropionate/trans-cinnamate dioxygenase ferredoxin component
MPVPRDDDPPIGFLDRALPTEFLLGKRTRRRVGRASDLPPGTVRGVGPYAVGNAGGEYFAVTRSCRHLLGDLARGRIDRTGCLVCPVHGARYDVRTGRMVQGPRGIYARVPGLGLFFRFLSRVLPLGRGEITERSGTLHVR